MSVRRAASHWPKILRISFGLLFLWSGGRKLFAPVSFADAVNAYGLLPEELVGVVAVAIMLIEVTLGTALVCGYRVRPAVAAACVLLCVFTAALISAVSGGRAIDCGCSLGFEGGPSVGWGAIARNLTLILWAAGIFLAHRPARDEGARPEGEGAAGEATELTAALQSQD